VSDLSFFLGGAEYCLRGCILVPGLALNRTHIVQIGKALWSLLLLLLVSSTMTTCHLALGKAAIDKVCMLVVPQPTGSAHILL
jgi:hypothetical protein